MVVGKMESGVIFLIFQLDMVVKELKLRTNLIFQTETQELDTNNPGAHRDTMRS